MNDPRTDLTVGKIVLITGGTSGIGKATATGLAAMGAHVAITGRNRERAEQAVDQIGAATGTHLDVFIADLSSQSEVRRLAGEVLQTYPRLDVLVNNAWATGAVVTSLRTGSSTHSPSITSHRSC